MFYSKKYKFLYIACPKTGSTSVEKFLFEIDPNGENHSITLENKLLKGRDMPFGVIGHARAWEFRSTLGNEQYEKLHVFGFMRHPYDKLVSSYFFNKRLSLKNAFFINGNKLKYIRMISTFLTRLTAKILPFNLWVLLYPMKTSREYFIDKDDRLIVDYVGRTEFLEQDLKKIFNKIGIGIGDSNVPHINKSKHTNYTHYFKNRFIRGFLEKKYKKDLVFYNEMSKKMDMRLQKQ